VKDVIKESDLYEPISAFLKENNFVVRGEVKNCDMMAVMGERIVIVELKKSFQLKLVYQALERQALSDEVYVAIPRPIGQNTKAWKSMMKLLTRLDIGLFTVALDSPIQTVDVILSPKSNPAWKNNKKMKALEKEFSGRSADRNLGGIHQKKIITAYRERVISLCCLLDNLKQASLKELRELGFSAKELSVLSANYEGKFERVQKGVYRLTALGQETLQEKDYLELVNYYREHWG